MKAEPLIAAVKAGSVLEPVEIESAVAGLFSNQWNTHDKVAFLESLAIRGEAASEITAFALAIRRMGKSLGSLGAMENSIDVCGTGADRSGTFNVSTTVMFVLAAAGVPVTKHGNRSISSSCGSADVLEALGARIALEPKSAAECFKRVGITFLFAPFYHEAFQIIAPVRRSLAQRGVRTIFNLLGPLLNPAHPAYQLVGVFSPHMTNTYARVLQELGLRGAMTAHGSIEGTEMGLDELSTLGATAISVFRAGGPIETSTIDARSYGIARSTLADLAGGTATANASILRDILGDRLRGAPQDLIVFNAAAALMVVGKVQSIAEGISLSRDMIRSGLGVRKLEQFVELSRSMSG